MIPTYFLLLSLIIISCVVYECERKVDELPCSEIMDSADYEYSEDDLPILRDGDSNIHHDCLVIGDDATLYRYGNGEWYMSNFFPSIPHTFWYTLVTFTTVGYGDMIPKTSVGRLIASFAFFNGIFFLAMPLSIVGSSFNDAWEKHCQEKLEKIKLQQARQIKMMAYFGSEVMPDMPKVSISRHEALLHVEQIKLTMAENPKWFPLDQKHNVEKHLEQLVQSMDEVCDKTREKYNEIGKRRGMIKSEDDEDDTTTTTKKQSFEVET